MNKERAIALLDMAEVFWPNFYQSVLYRMEHLTRESFRVVPEWKIFGIVVRKERRRTDVEITKIMKSVDNWAFDFFGPKKYKAQELVTLLKFSIKYEACVNFDEYIDAINKIEQAHEEYRRNVGETMDHDEFVTNYAQRYLDCWY